MVRVDRTHREGPRLYLAGKRVHHWELGAALAMLGTWLIWDDRADLPGRACSANSWAHGKTATARPLLFDPDVGVTTTNVRDGIW